MVRVCVPRYCSFLLLLLLLLQLLLMACLLALGCPVLLLLPSTPTAPVLDLLCFNSHSFPWPWWDPARGVATSAIGLLTPRRPSLPCATQAPPRSPRHPPTSSPPPPSFPPCSPALCLPFVLIFLSPSSLPAIPLSVSLSCSSFSLLLPSHSFSPSYLHFSPLLPSLAPLLSFTPTFLSPPSLALFPPFHPHLSLPPPR